MIEYALCAQITYGKKEIGSLSGLSQRTTSVYKEETAFSLKPKEVVESFYCKRIICSLLREGMASFIYCHSHFIQNSLTKNTYSLI